MGHCRGNNGSSWLVIYHKKWNNFIKWIFFLKLDINNNLTIFEYCHRKLLCEFIMWETFMHSNMTLGLNFWLGFIGGRNRRKPPQTFDWWVAYTRNIIYSSTGWRRNIFFSSTLLNKHNMTASSYVSSSKLHTSLLPNEESYIITTVWLDHFWRCCCPFITWNISFKSLYVQHLLHL